MNINIHGHHIDTGAALRTHVEERLPDMIDKYFSEAKAEATITFAKQGASFTTTSAVHLDSGFYLHASGSAGEIYKSFDQSLVRLEKQLRRYKRRLKNHHKAPILPNALSHAPEKIFAPEAATEEVQEEFVPVIIAEDQKVIPRLTMSEAVMQLEVGQDDFVIFKTAGNADKDKSGKRQLIYKRGDKNIGWMELD